MAEKTGSYPMLPTISWWALRQKFQNKIPSKVTKSYLSSVLNISQISAQNNILPYLRTMGLIDDEFRPTELANDWRFDDKYPETCKIIISKIYDQELLDAFPTGTEDRRPIERWFAAKTQSGKVAARRMATLYKLLTKADPSEGVIPAQKKLTTTKPKATSKEPAILLEPKKQREQQAEGHPIPTYQASANQPFPSLHIDVQIHLSPQAPPEQIDKVFESLAKHLKDLYKPNAAKK